MEESPSGFKGYELLLAAVGTAMVLRSVAKMVVFGIRVMRGVHS